MAESLGRAALQMVVNIAVFAGLMVLDGILAESVGWAFSVILIAFMLIALVVLEE